MVVKQVWSDRQLNIQKFFSEIPESSEKEKYTYCTVIDFSE